MKNWEPWVDETGAPVKIEGRDCYLYNPSEAGKKRKLAVAQAALDYLWADSKFYVIHDMFVAQISGKIAGQPGPNHFLKALTQDMRGLKAYCEIKYGFHPIVKDIDGNLIELVPSLEIRLPARHDTFVADLAKFVRGFIKNLDLPPDYFHLFIVTQALIWPTEIRNAQDLYIPPLYFFTFDYDNLLQHSTASQASARDDREAGSIKSDLRHLMGQAPQKLNWGSLSGAERDYSKRAIDAADRYDELKASDIGQKTYDRYQQIGNEQYLSEKTAERDVLRGRKLRRPGRQEISDSQ